MKVRCIYNTGKNLPNDLKNPNSFLGDKTKFDLIIGKEYVVYGMALQDNYMYYYICDEIYTQVYNGFPFLCPSPIFEITDHRLSNYWVFGLSMGESKYTTYTEIVYPEWLNDPYYYDKLTDGDEEEIKIFLKYKELMDKEFEVESTE